MRLPNILTLFTLILASAANAMPWTENMSELKLSQALALNTNWSCVAVHLNVSCPTATVPFRAQAFIYQLRDIDDQVVAERWLESSTERPQWASATLRGCGRVTSEDLSNRFGYEIDNQTCVPYMNITRQYLPFLRPSGHNREYFSNWTLGAAEWVTVDEVSVGNETNALVERSFPPPANTTELVRTGAPRHCIKLHVELKCRYPFNATVRIWKSRPELIGYWVAETRINTSADADYGIFLAAASMDVCVPLADASGINNRDSALFFSIPKQSCPESYEYKHDSDSIIPFRYETTEYDLQFGLWDIRPVIEPHIEQLKELNEQLVGIGKEITETKAEVKELRAHLTN